MFVNLGAGGYVSISEHYGHSCCLYDTMDPLVLDIGFGVCVGLAADHFSAWAPA